MNRTLMVCGLGFQAVALGLGTQAASAQLVTVFAENWENFPLGPNVDEGVAFNQALGQQTNVVFGELNDDGVPINDEFDGSWTFGGWNQTFNLFGIGAAEWQGWSIVNGNFWVGADDQRRNEFVGQFTEFRGVGGPRGVGAVAVADPDEWDDFDPFGIDPDQFVDPVTGDDTYDTTLTSPVIAIPAEATAGSLVLQFDSSWRPENNQKARLSAAFNGGAFQTVFTWTSNAADPAFNPASPQGDLPTYKNDESTNERLAIAFNNQPGDTSVQFRWELFDADNNWWWAIDNIDVGVEGIEPVLPPSPFDLILDQFSNNTNVTVAWTAASNADSYDVLIARDPSFSDIAFSTNTTDLAASTPLKNGVYYARVTARNGIGSLSRSRTFALDGGCDGDFNGDQVNDVNDVVDYVRGFVFGCDGSLNN